jgi:hypothetical protein
MGQANRFLLLVVVGVLMSVVSCSKPPEPKAGEKIEGSDVRSPIIRENVQVSIISVAKGIPPLSRRVKPDPGESLIVIVEIKNTSKQRILRYLGWGMGGVSKLTDNVPNAYMPKAIGPAIKGATVTTFPYSLYPGKSVRDFLVFEPPVEGVDLKLILPGKTVGEEKDFGFQIPGNMITAVSIEPEDMHADEPEPAPKGKGKPKVIPDDEGSGGGEKPEKPVPGDKSKSKPKGPVDGALPDVLPIGP